MRCDAVRYDGEEVVAWRALECGGDGRPWWMPATRDRPHRERCTVSERTLTYARACGGRDARRHERRRAVSSGVERLVACVAGRRARRVRRASAWHTRGCCARRALLARVCPSPSCKHSGQFVSARLRAVARSSTVKEAGVECERTSVFLERQRCEGLERVWRSTLRARAASSHAFDTLTRRRSHTRRTSVLGVVLKQVNNRLRTRNLYSDTLHNTECTSVCTRTPVRPFAHSRTRPHASPCPRVLYLSPPLPSLSSLSLSLLRSPLPTHGDNGDGSHHAHCTHTHTQREREK